MKRILLALIAVAFIGGCTSASYTNIDNKDVGSNQENMNQNSFFPDSPVTDQMTLIHAFF
ncbi:hypothetical protein L4C54_08335 [Vibrio lamellibrachiae]|uniref:hypothetical protein n=1 Tax=Vibrio lamellibrachiae TaxID=2910253 RepID=UPI003D0D2A11